MFLSDIQGSMMSTKDRIKSNYHILLKLQNQQKPSPSIYSKVGCFWPNLVFDFFAYIFPAIYGVSGNTMGSFIR